MKSSATAASFSWYDLFSFWAAIRFRSGHFCWMAIAILPFLAACGGVQQGPEQPGVTLSSGKISFHDFTVVADKVEERSKVEILLRGSPVSSDAELFTEVDLDEIKEDFPRKTCDTLKVNLFTGGANCCFGYYLLTSCNRKDAAAYIPPLDGGIGPASMEGAYSVTDPFFMYYEKADSAHEGVSFSRVDSPRPERLIIFDKGVWRIDKRGEFRDFYLKQAEALEQEKNIDPAAKAIVMGYYTIMAGEDLTKALHAFKTGLPERFAGIASEIFTDLESSSREFNPVEVLTLP